MLIEELFYPFEVRSDLDEDRAQISYRYPGALGLALLFDGCVEQISISYGTSIDVGVLNRDNFK